MKLYPSFMLLDVSLIIVVMGRRGKGVARWRGRNPASLPYCKV